MWRWEFAAAAVALAAAALAFWITMNAHFLAYSDWLAVQKADFILGPIASGSTGATDVLAIASGSC